MENLFFAQKAFIVDGGYLLSIRKGMDDPFNPGKWEVPGGRMKGDEAPDEHIKREVMEEVGVEIIPGMPFYVWSWENKKNDILYKTVALARICKALEVEVKSDNQMEDDYIAMIKWIPLSSLREYSWIGNMMPVIDMFERVMLCGYGDLTRIFYENKKR